MEILKVENIKVVRGGTTVLRQVTWQMLPGQRWVIMGANGSGKTSLLSVLTGFLVPTEGNMTLLGQVYGEDDWSHLKRVVSLVSSSVRQMVNDDELALEIIASGLHGQINYWGRLKPQEISAAEKLGRSVGCGKILDRPWAVLSQGERQRVLIGRALIANPRLLILDEPCAGLDPAAREQFLAFLDQLAQKENGPALILVTHHVEEITPSFTHVLGLKNGRVILNGEKEASLTSAHLSVLFDAEVTVTCESDRYGLTIKPRAKRAI